MAPFLFHGGDVTLPISCRTSLYAEVLWDLIFQDEVSPNKTVEPFIRLGIYSETRVPEHLPLIVDLLPDIPVIFTEFI